MEEKGLEERRGKSRSAECGVVHQLTRWCVLAIGCSASSDSLLLLPHRALRFAEWNRKSVHLCVTSEGRTVQHFSGIAFGFMVVVAALGTVVSDFV